MSSVRLSDSRALASCTEVRTVWTQRAMPEIPGGP